MKIEEFKDFTIQDYHHLLEEKKISPLELVNIFLERIEEGEDKIHAFCSSMRKKRKMKLTGKN